MMDLEKRERELKSLLDMADGIEERKKLRSELREIRQKMFEAPGADITSSVQTMNARNESLTIVFGKSEDRNNNLPTLGEGQQYVPPKLSEAQSDYQKSLRAKPAGEELGASREIRGGHANLMRNEKGGSVGLCQPGSSVHVDNNDNLRGRSESESLVTKKFGAITISTSVAAEKPVGYNDVDEDGEKGDAMPGMRTGSAVASNKLQFKTPLGRSASWSGKQAVDAATHPMSAAVTVVPARNKFEVQVGKPLEFGTSYVNKSKDLVTQVPSGRVGSQTGTAMQSRSPNKYVPTQALVASNRYGPGEVTKGDTGIQPGSPASTGVRHASAFDEQKAPALAYSNEEAKHHHPSASSVSLGASNSKPSHVMSTESKAAIASIRRVASMRVQPTWSSVAPAEPQATSVSSGAGITETVKPPLNTPDQHFVSSASNTEGRRANIAKVGLQPLTIRRFGDTGDDSNRMSGTQCSPSASPDGVGPKSLSQPVPDLREDAHPKLTAVASAPNVASLPLQADRQRSATQPIAEQSRSLAPLKLQGTTPRSPSTGNNVVISPSTGNNVMISPSTGNNVVISPSTGNNVMISPSTRNNVVFSRNGADQGSTTGRVPPASTKTLSPTTPPSTANLENNQPKSPIREEKPNRSSLSSCTLVSPIQEKLAIANCDDSLAHSSSKSLARDAVSIDSSPALGIQLSRAPLRSSLEVSNGSPLKSSEVGSPTRPLGSGIVESRTTDVVCPVSPPPTISISTDFADAIPQRKVQAAECVPTSPTKSLEPPQSDSYLYKRAEPTPRRHHPSAPGLVTPDAEVKKNQSVSNRASVFQKAAEEEQAKVDKEKNQLSVRQSISKASSTGNLPEATKEAEKREDDKKTTAPCLKKREKKRPVRRTMSISSIVLDWVQEMVSDYEDYGVEVKNFSSSWNNGMAFCALIHKFNPDSFDFSTLRKENKRYNFELAFKTGLERKNIPILLDVEDMIRMEKPEPRSVQCYVQWIWSVYGPTSGYGPSMDEIKQAQVA